MKMMQKALFAALFMVAAGAMAQEGGAQPQPLTPEQQELIKRQDAELTQAALQVVQMVDAGGIAEIWDGLSQTVKPLIPRDDFIRHVGDDRDRLGAVQSRGEAVVSRSQFEAGGEVPEGLYINVAFPTKFANLEQPVRELVSFRLDEDRTWRVSGYTLR